MAIFRAIIFTVILIGLSLTASSQNWKTYPYNQTGSVLNFPDDEGYHPGEPVEWWYTTAHVIGDSTGTDYSFMHTFFYYPAFTYDGFRIFNLANENTGEFYPETMPLTYDSLSQDNLFIQANVGFAGGTTEIWESQKDSAGNLMPFQYHVSANSAFGAIDVYYNTVKRPLMVGDTGLFPIGANAWTYYYSLTMLEATGTITLNGVTESISGTAWIDRQWGDFNPSNMEQYEWFSLQLSNGMDINLWNIFTDNDEIPDTSTYRFCSVYINDSTDMTLSEFELDRLSYECIPNCYAQKWNLKFGNVDLIITTLFSDNEVTLPFTFYEGSTTIEGTVDGVPVTGVGFAELLHMYDNPDITMSDSWDLDQPITWQLNNPDDGRPVYYDVEVSTDNQATFSSIYTGTTDTSYIWVNNLPNGTEVWVRVAGYSIDSTLIGYSDVTNGTVGINELNSETINSSAYPIPFNNSVTINYQLEHTGEVQIDIYNLQGSLVANVFKGNQNAGNYNIDWNAKNIEGQDVPSGVYFYQIKIDAEKEVKPIICVK